MKCGLNGLLKKESLLLQNNFLLSCMMFLIKRMELQLNKLLVSMMVKIQENAN
jgi:hypothetical protein